MESNLLASILLYVIGFVVGVLATLAYVNLTGYVG
jgi:hypothetical protein